MKKKYAMKWARALESGKYKQTGGALQLDSSYCCLGVLCRIAGEQGKIIGGTMKDQLKIRELVGFKTDSGELPLSFRVEEGEQRHLIYLNDEKRLSFKQIAKLVRRYWRYL